MMNFSTIAFSKGYFFVPSTNVTDEDNLKFLSELRTLSSEITSIQAEVMRYGYMFDAASLRAMMNMSASDLAEVTSNLSEYLADTYGDGTFVSLFGNFPETRLNMTEIEVFVKQMVHYLSDGLYDPSISVDNELDAELIKDHYDPCFKDSYRLIKLANADTLISIFKNICSAQQSITSYDKDVVVYFCENYKSLDATRDIKIEDILPETIPFKETLCLVASTMPEARLLMTVNDVLRLAVYMSGGDIALPAMPKAKDYGWERMMTYSSYYKDALKELRDKQNFIKFNRSERRLILSNMEYALSMQTEQNAYADMKKYASKWVRLGEILHPGEYKNQFPNAAKAFYIIRETAQYITTFNGRLELARKNGDVEDVVNVLAERPTEFARNIDWVLRKYTESSTVVIGAFSAVIDKVSTKVLYELLDHYNNRNSETTLKYRTVFFKGARKPVRIKELPALDSAVRRQVLSMLVNELSSRFADKGDLSNVKYILDMSLSNIRLPKNMRSMNIAPGQQSRGTKLPIKCDTGILRMYCRWVDTYGRYDLDLSCTGLGEDMKKKFTLSWNSSYGLKHNNKTVAIFSGDVRHRVGNSAEYIDVDIKGMQEMGVRYLIGDVRDFDGQGFTVKDAWGGVMERETFGKPGEATWAPDTITTGFRLTSACTNIIMTIVDLKEMVMYVVDEDMAGIPVASCYGDIYKTIVNRYVNNKPYFNALSLISLNLKSRGADVTVLGGDDFTNTVNALEESKKKLQTLLKSAEDVRDATDRNDSRYVEACGQVTLIREKLDMVNSVKTISYDDIAVDYTTIFEWMF